ncbi:MAG: hydroxymethylglutaryl-CoA lyase [Synergistaceae bacterium]|jgi:hydroxymethylglutaryl-CoA lyase|nr:hydroxymethylglutaryl-CoA lyase [Synergistaceae bacterium]
MAPLDYPEAISVTEVCTRDGFQNHKTFIPTEVKIEILDALAALGFAKMEVTSFVSPKAIPQMVDAAEVMSHFQKKWGDRIAGFALVPNRKGAELAIRNGAEALVFVLSASEEHNKANTNRTIEESLSELQDICRDFGGLEISVGLGTSFECPFSGTVAPEKVTRVIDAAFEYGVDHITISDTTGSANPRGLERTLEIVRSRYESAPFALHLHDTHGMGLANALTAMNMGFTTFETATAGMGGCPFAPGASGNLATEDLVNMAGRMGIDTGIDLIELLRVSREIAHKLALPWKSHVASTRIGLDEGVYC